MKETVSPQGGTIKIQGDPDASPFHELAAPDGENGRHIHFVSYSETKVVVHLSFLRLTGVFSNDEYKGGAIHIDHYKDAESIWHITSCVFEGCKATEPFCAKGSGGSIAIGLQSSTTQKVVVNIKDSHFKNIRAKKAGGAISFNDMRSSSGLASSELNIEGSTFEECSANLYNGGAVSAYSTTNLLKVKITSSTFKNNKAGSVIYVAKPTEMKITLPGEGKIGLECEVIYPRCLVTKVTPGSAADKANILFSDTIVSIDGTAVGA